MTRNEWLTAAVKLFRPAFRRIGYPLPLRCWAACQNCSAPAHWAETYFPNLTHVSPRIDDGYKVLTSLAHELCHQACNEWLGVQSGHGSSFMIIARALGMESNTGGFPVQDHLEKKCLRWAKKLGKYPRK
jgi:hypothetical protein